MLLKYVPLLLLVLVQHSIAVYPVIYQKTTFFTSLPRTGVAATSAGSFALFAGGITRFDNVSDVVDVFNTETRQWSTAKLSQPRLNAYTASVGQLALFAFGEVGNVSKTVDIFDASSGEWSTYPLCTEVASITATTYVGNYMLYWGEANNATVVCRFDPIAHQWTVEEIGPYRHRVPAAASVGKYALFAGGTLELNGTTTKTNLVSIFDSETLQWSTATLSQARYSLAATSTGDYAFFGGGLASSSPPAYYDTVDVFDAKTLTWSVNSLSRPKTYLAATSVGTYAIFGGGLSQTKNAPDVDIFDTTTKLWTYANLASGRYQSTATSAGKFAFFATGYDDQSLPSGTIDLFEFPDLSASPTASNTPAIVVPVPTSSTSNSNVPVESPLTVTSEASLHSASLVWVASLGFLLLKELI